MEEEVEEVQTPEYELDLDNIPPVAHNWVKRGAKVSCEGTLHPHHSHFLTKRGSV